MWLGLDTDRMLPFMFFPVEGRCSCLLKSPDQRCLQLPSILSAANANVGRWYKQYFQDNRDNLSSNFKKNHFYVFWDHSREEESWSQ